MKNIHLLIFVVMATAMMSQLSFAQQDPEEQAGLILDKLSDQYQEYGAIKADFRFIKESRDEEDDFREEREGTIYMKGDKFRLVLDEQEIICNNETIWTHIKAAREVQINNFNPETFEFHPSEVFTIYKEDYRYVYAGKKLEGGRVFDVVELSPLDRDDMVFKIRLYIDQHTGNIARSLVFEKSGLLFTYEILDMDTNVNLDDQFFTFNESENPDVVVIDLR